MTEKKENCVELFGQAAEAPVFSHESHGERFVLFPLEVKRLSGASDRIMVISLEQSALEIEPGSEIGVLGEMRSFNNHSGRGNRLIISVLARELYMDGECHVNKVSLCGVICKPPVYRKTPMGREICDIMLAVNRKYGRADYLPCIAWGRHARRAGDLRVGSEIRISGRIQSRDYIKIIEEGVELSKTAFEISINELEIMSKEAKS